MMEAYDANPEEIAGQVRYEVAQERISQNVFAKVVLNRTGGLLSQILSDPNYASHQKHIRVMAAFLLLPREQRLQLYQREVYAKGLEYMSPAGISEQTRVLQSPRKRTHIPQEAKMRLNATLHTNLYPSQDMVIQLAQELAMEETAVKLYFKNKRAALNKVSNLV